MTTAEQGYVPQDEGPTLAPVHVPFDSRFTVLADTAYPTV